MRNNIQQFSISEDTEEKYYCQYGQEDFIDEDGWARLENPNNENILAKAVQNKKPKNITEKIKHYRFFLKVSPNMELYNPKTIHSSLSSKQQKQFSYINKTCKSSWIFKEVDQNLFNRYLLFLKTMNMQTFKDIQRQLK